MTRSNGGSDPAAAHAEASRLHDLHIAALLKEHGVRALCTRDTDFHRFGFLEVVDPPA